MAASFIPPVFGVTGWKNSGKTTLTTHIISELTARGYQVASIKHAHHLVDVDTPGTDSYRHREAGAKEVALVGGSRWAIMHEFHDDPEPALEDIIHRLGPADIVIIEGYKKESHLKIETRRLEARKQEPLAPNDPNIVAIAADHSVLENDRPTFSLDDITGIVDLIVERLGLANANHDQKA